VICSFERTFCKECAKTLGGKCAGCKGQLSPRPVREASLLGKYPASNKRIYKPERCGPNAGKESGKPSGKQAS
jgi:hypothetical protein